MSTIQQLVDTLGPGWKIVGNGVPVEDTSVVTVSDPTTLQTSTVNRGTGKYFITVQDPDGHQRALFLKAQPVKGGLEVKQTGVNDQIDDPTSASGKKPNPNIYTGDLKAIQWDQAGPLGDVPAGQGGKASDPSKWQPIYRTPGDPSSELVGQWDPVNNEMHAVAAAPGAKPTGVYTNVVDPNDPNGKRVIGMVDNGDNSWHPVAAGPDGTQVVTTPTAVYLVDKDKGTSSKLFDVAQNSPKQAVVVNGKVFSFDPSNGQFTEGPVNDHPDIKDSQNNVMVWTSQPDGSGKYDYPPGVKPAATVGNSTTLKELVWYDAQGNEIARHANPNYQAPAQTPPPTNTVAPMIQVQDPNDPSKLVWVENKARVTASQALQDLAAKLTGHVVDKNISMEDAKALIDAANQNMTAQAQKQAADTAQQKLGLDAAGNVITNVNQAAQTGGNILQNRVSQAMGGFNNAVSAIGSSKMTSAPAGMGANLVNGLQEWVTQLGGGQQVYDSAAAMVNAADPTVRDNPTVAQQAYATLRGAMDLYKQQTGQDYKPPAQRDTGPMTSPTTLPDGTPITQAQTNVMPNPAATAAAAAATPGGYNPQASTAALNQQGLVDNPAGRALAAGQSSVPGAPPVVQGQYNPIWQQGVRSAVGAPATGPVVGPVAPLPIPQGPWYPGGQFAAPVTV